MIRNKILHPEKIRQFNERLTVKFNCEPTRVYNETSWEGYRETNLIINAWLSGFISGDGSLDIMIRKPNKGFVQVALRVQVSQNEKSLLLLIKFYFGGSISLNRNCYNYTISGLKDLAKLVEYLDKFKLKGNKQRDFLIFRSVFVLMQAKGHLTKEGLAFCIQKKEELRLNRVKKFDSEELYALEIARLKGHFL